MTDSPTSPDEAREALLIRLLLRGPTTCEQLAREMSMEPRDLVIWITTEPIAKLVENTLKLQELCTRFAVGHERHKAIGRLSQMMEGDGVHETVRRACSEFMRYKTGAAPPRVRPAGGGGGGGGEDPARHGRGDRSPGEPPPPVGITPQERREWSQINIPGLTERELPYFRPPGSAPRHPAASRSPP